MKRRPVDIHVVRFGFDCDNLIRLHGIVLGIHLKDIAVDSISDKISISAKFDDDSFAAFESKCKFYQSTTTKNESIIVFENPIDRLTGFNCSVKLPPLQLNYDLVLDDDVEVDNVQFTFNGGWITRVLFDKIVQPGKRRRNI